MGVYLQSVLNEIGYKALGQADLREHLLHLRAEHEEQGADQRAAVVPGLPGCVGLPLHPVRLRVVPPRQRLEHQHLGLLQQADQRADAQGAEPRRRRTSRPRTPLWAKIDKAVTDQAPMATLFTPKHVDFVSKRVGNFIVQQAVLLARRPVVGAVGRSWGPSRGPAPAEPDGVSGRSPTGCRAPAARAPVGASPWALARRRLRRNRIAMAMLGVLVAHRRRSASRRRSTRDHVAHTDPFRSNLDGTTIVDGKTRAGDAAASTTGSVSASRRSARPGTRATTSSAPTTRGATSPRACSTAGATRC